MKSKGSGLEIEKAVKLRLRKSEIKELRNSGYSLQAIGDYFGISRERVRQILMKHYGTTEMKFMPRNQVAKMIGCSEEKLRTLERRGVVKSAHLGFRYLYTMKDVRKAALRIKRSKQRIERTCKVCGKKFYVRLSEIRPTSPCKFCSKRCFGTWVARHYGFRKKWKLADYRKVQRLKAKTGWGAVRIGRELGMPARSVAYLLRNWQNVAEAKSTYNMETLSRSKKSKVTTKVKRG